MNTFSSQYVIGSIKIFKSVCRCFRHTHWTVSRSNPNKTTDRFLIRSVLHERMNFLACAEYKTDYFCFKIGKILTRHHGSLLNLLRIIQEMEKGSKWYLLRRQRKLLKDFTTWLIVHSLSHFHELAELYSLKFLGMKFDNGGNFAVEIVINDYERIYLEKDVIVKRCERESQTDRFLKDKLLDDF